MYKIIGVDQKEYGPISAEQLRQWIAEGRANAQTLVQAQAGGEWKPLASFPEFSEALAARVSLNQPPPRIGQANPGALAEEILVRDYQVNIGHCFGRSWDLLKQNFWVLVGATLIIALLQTVAELIPPGKIVGLALQGVLWGGLSWLFLKLARRQSAGVEDAFAGFKLAFVQLMLAGVISSVLVCVGLFLFILPGIYLLVAWMMFSNLLVIDKKLDFWPAMELSRKVVHKHWWKMFGLLLVSVIVAMAGVLAFGIGVFVTMPLAVGATVYAYEDIFGDRAALPAPSTLTIGS